MKCYFKTKMHFMYPGTFLNGIEGQKEKIWTDYVSKSQNYTVF